MRLATLAPSTDGGLATADPSLIEVRHRLDGLSSALAKEPDDICDVLSMRDESDALFAYLVGVHAARELQV